MLDEYGLRLLAEIGVDVYAPRPVANSAASVPEPAASPVRVPAVQSSNSTHVDVLILGSAGSASRMLEDLLRAFRSVKLRAELSSVVNAGNLADVRSLVVLGESLARTLGAEMPAQRHKEINWIFTSEPGVLVASATAKQGLWGEIKRLSRSLRVSGTQV